MELLVYIPKQTPRINYIFRHICGRILGFKVKFCSKVEDFIAFEGVKFSYAKKKLGNEVFIQQFGLLGELGINDLNFSMDIWEDVPCFFRVSSESDIPFDIFSASFYLVTRYEEYQPHVKNDVDSYPIEESLAYQHDFLKTPVVDVWAYKLKAILEAKFPDLKFPEKRFKSHFLISVSKAFKHRHNGLVRFVGASLRDLIHLQLKSMFDRFKTMLRLQQDPYDIYDELIDFAKENKMQLDFYFQLSNYSRYTKSISYNKRIYHKLIKSMGDYGHLGLLPGFEALYSIDILKKEKKRWENIVNRSLTKTLIKNYHLNFPDAFLNFNKLEIEKDFSMGYQKNIGFRAGTCTSFQFYDLNMEQVSGLVIQPYVLNSNTLKGLDLYDQIDELKNLKHTVKAVNGQMNFIFENSDFSEPSLKNAIFVLIKEML
ncbi:polysaccharide deacetylase family protein [Psychroflexus sp. CAK57W]|uniref:polysaccharide deacetylase family protein n=1 Tax=Psychroflexus curvus TaxID=2873595 RepID=UPI001CCC069B|nr:polysaccharide deacetylase family protein [Psychroflexus curvus]MBZ9628251.1 polysaccharide deacetylase family protein [Psychroflexus curvus]MBZ9788286.1 polysaccharide deacetylase family protein [Psychroflexus curvus]